MAPNTNRDFCLSEEWLEYQGERRLLIGIRLDLG